VIWAQRECRVGGSEDLAVVHCLGHTERVVNASRGVRQVGVKRGRISVINVAEVNDASVGGGIWQGDCGYVGAGGVEDTIATSRARIGLGKDHGLKE